MDTTKKFIICIGRSYGSGGAKFARLLSEKLGVPLYDKNILDVVAKDANIRRELLEQVDESYIQTPPMLYGTGYIASSTYLMYSDNYLSNENLFKFQSDTIRRLAKEGSAIFVGRCADFVLKGTPNLISIFLSDNIEERIKRVMERTPELTREKEAVELIKGIDRKRREYYNYYTSGKWGRAYNYDLTFKLSTIGWELTIQLIEDLLRSKNLIP